MSKFDIYKIPAFCHFCGTLFNTSLEVRVTSGVEFFDFTTDVPFFCPSCGNQAEVRGDLLTILKDSIESLKKLTIKDLLELEGKLKSKFSKNMSEADFKSAKEDLITAMPEVSSIKDLLPRSRTEAYTVIGLIITLILGVATVLSSGGSVNNYNIVNNVIVSPDNKYLPVPTPAPKKIVSSKNQRCPCGSKLKFKRCHGKENPKR